ncbi:ATP-binding cassette subfamily B protein [Brevibacterium sanguinis]|uniref:ATP-binding cassette subfamily B protein n=2 Tax=Brevibacterium TaxID=1696 RepID=A0A366IHA4_9MICO|nr:MULTISPECIES: ABC transporter ATP-binding protein [Brevibacterium]RBP64938.1 ATP-binding cassette subfamily B protein [Brevibacterium sanguinis]RBP71201.1 ATP-binding cassette subfamily B protein [Brevibacterium celere]
MRAGSTPRRRLLLCLVAAVSAAGAEVLALGAVGDLISSPTAPTVTALLLWVLTWVLCSGVAVWSGRSCGYGLSAALHDALAAHLLRLPLLWFGRRRHGEISRLFGADVMAVMSIPAHLLVPATRSVLVTCGIIVLLLGKDVPTGLIALAWLPVLTVLQLWSARRAATGDAALAHARRESADRVIEFVDAQRTLRLLPDTGHAAEILRESVAEVSERTEAQVESVVRVLGVFGLAVQLMFVTVAGSGLLRGDWSDPGQAVVIVLGAGTMAAVLQSGAGLAATIRAALGSWSAIRSFLALPPLPEPESPRHTDGQGDILVEGLTVESAGMDPVLADLSFHVPPGSLTVVLGASGSGKSTLLRMLARFADPDSGRVLIDGVDCRELGSAGVHDRVSMVFQDVELFAGDLRDNIRLGRPEADSEEVDSVVALAGLDETIGELPEGLGTTVGDHGAGLSGGQRQRLSFARALLADTPILLLDEPASSLDAHHGTILETTIAGLRGHRTVVLVTHRVESAQAADQILVLDGGRIVERGRHEDLLTRDGPYSRLCAAAMTDHTAPKPTMESTP